MLRLDANATPLALPERELVDAMGAMFDRAARGEATAPQRVHLDLPGGGVLLLMPAYDAKHTLLKTVTVHAANARGRLPVVQGEVVLMDTTTGRRLMQLDGAALTARRTAALSAAGLQRLGRTGSTRLLLIGAGVQAAMHARFFLKMWPLTELLIASRDDTKAQALAQALRDENLRSVVRIGVTQDVQAAALRAQVIITATNSATPVLHGPVNPRASIVAVGSYRASMAELSPDVVQACSVVVVDSLTNATHEAGDLIQAGVDWARVIDLSAAGLLPTDLPGPVLLKTVGHALWDLAAAQLAWEQVRPG